MRRHIVRRPSASAVPSRGALRLIVASRPFTAQSIKMPLDDEGGLASQSPYNASGWEVAVNSSYGVPFLLPSVAERHQVGAFPSSVEPRLTSVELRLAFPSAPAFNVLRPSVVN